MKDLNDRKATETLTRATEIEELKTLMNANLQKHKEDVDLLNKELEELRDAKTTVKKSQDEAIRGIRPINQHAWRQRWQWWRGKPVFVDKIFLKVEQSPPSFGERY